MLVFILSLGLIVFLLLAEMPIAFAFGIGALVFGVASGSDVSFLIPFAYQTTSSFALLALPLFVMAGTLMAEAPISGSETCLLPARRCSTWRRGSASSHSTSTWCRP